MKKKFQFRFFDDFQDEMNKINNVEEKISNTQKNLELFSEQLREISSEMEKNQEVYSKIRMQKLYSEIRKFCKKN